MTKTKEVQPCQPALKFQFANLIFLLINNNWNNIINTGSPTQENEALASMIIFVITIMIIIFYIFIMTIKIF